MAVRAAILVVACRYEIGEALGVAPREVSQALIVLAKVRKKDTRG